MERKIKDLINRLTKCENKALEILKEVRNQKAFELIEYDWIEHHFPKNQGNDKTDFIDSILPNGVYCYHIDSYTYEPSEDNEQISKRFQGMFYSVMNANGTRKKYLIAAPLSVLKLAVGYQMGFYGVNRLGDSVNCYTIWFD